MLVRLAPFLLWVATVAASQVSSPGDPNDEEAGLDDDDNDAHDKNDDSAHNKDEECSWYRAWLQNNGPRKGLLDILEE